MDTKSSSGSLADILDWWAENEVYSHATRRPTGSNF